MNKHVLVAGASGLVGCAAMQHLASLPDCRVTAISRRSPRETGGARFIPVDLSDARATAELAASLGDVTHLVYAALHEEPGLIAGWRAQTQIEANDRMLRNLMEPLTQAATGLVHVALLQGTKAYGAHIAPIAIPAREDRSELHGHANFYWQQENYIREKQQGQGWAWTILRPQIVFGGAVGSAMNLIAAIGAWAALLKHEGRPLAWPGGPASILEAVDAGLLARAIAWAGDCPAARNQTFNVTNGDVFVWRNVWPAIADAVGMKEGDAEPQSLARVLESEDARAKWDRVRKTHGLLAPPLADFLGLSHFYADFCFGFGLSTPGAAIVSTVKLRKAGFCKVVDTEEMFRRWFRFFQDHKLLPPR